MRYIGARQSRRAHEEEAIGSTLEVLRIFLRLGLTSFGGPAAHLGYFRAEFVARRRWLDESAFADLVALCQFLPGPASSQVGFALGLTRAGWLGGLAAWAGFTLPSAAAMIALALGAAAPGAGWSAQLQHGLKLVAVAIVAQAVLGMARALCPDRQRAALAVAGAGLSLLGPAAFGQLFAIALGALGGLLFCGAAEEPAAEHAPAPLSRRAGLACLALFALLLLAPGLLPGSPALALFDAFYRSGALVFGGGHVVLPVLREAMSARGWLGDDAILAGYGLAQALPGPLFTYAAWLGALASPLPGLPGGALALLAIFLPGLLLVAGALPFWARLRTQPQARSLVRGVNAAVVGLLGAALYDPIWTSAVHGGRDFLGALGLFVLATAWRSPPLLVVLAGALLGLLGA